jgi:hypothetical protein
VYVYNLFQALTTALKQNKERQKIEWPACPPGEEPWVNVSEHLSAASEAEPEEAEGEGVCVCVCMCGVCGLFASLPTYDICLL